MLLDPSIVSGQLLVNLDTEEDDAFYIGCAGAGGLGIELDLARADEAPGTARYRLAVRGLRGGHSGIDIHENRGNAIKIAARMLVAAVESGVESGLVALDGGDKANAVPRECFAELSLTADASAAFEAAVADLRPEIEADFGGVDPGLEIALEESTQESFGGPLLAADRDRLLHVVSAAPHGVIAMSREIPGLVETSNNLAVVRTRESAGRVECAFRSSVNAALSSTHQSLTSLARLAGGEVEVTRGYPGWKPDPESPIVKRTEAVYQRLFGKPPEVKAVHAGLECGILAEKVPGLDAV